VTQRISIAIAILCSGFAFAAGWLSSRATTTPRWLSYSRTANEIGPPERPESAFPGDPSGGLIIGEKAQALALKSFGKFAPLILSYDPSSEGEGQPERYYTTPRDSTAGTVCEAGELTVEPNYYTPQITYQNVYRVVGTTDPAHEKDPLFRKKVKATCALSVASGRWFSAASVNPNVDFGAGDSSAVAAERGARAIDQAVMAARAEAALPFKLDCDSGGAGLLDCKNPRQLLAAIDPREIASLVRKSEIGRPRSGLSLFGVSLCRETTRLEMLPQGQTAKKYVITTVEEDMNCRSGQTIHYTMDQVTIDEDDKIIN
jgi:hypothetical protein